MFTVHVRIHVYVTVESRIQTLCTLKNSYFVSTSLFKIVLKLRWELMCVGVGRQIYCKLTSIAWKYTQEARSSLRFAI